MNRYNRPHSPKPIVVVAAMSLMGIVACAAVIDLAEVAFEPGADGSLDAQAPPADPVTPVGGPDGSSDAQPTSSYLDDSAFCRGFPGARFCRQFDDDAAAGAGFMLNVVSGFFALDTIEAFSPPRSLSSRITGNGVATGVFVGAPTARFRLHFRMKIGISVDVGSAAIAQGRCFYVLSSEDVSTIVLTDAGANLADVHGLSRSLARDKWMEVVFQAEPSNVEASHVHLRLSVDGEGILDVIDSTACPVDRATGFYLGLRGARESAAAQAVQFDDVVFSAVP